MATKLKKMQLTSVDLVRAGANQEADICLYKSADPAGATEQATEHEKNVFKRFLNWLKENSTEAAGEPTDPIEKDYTTFDQINDNRENSDKLWRYTDALTCSIRSIQEDHDLDKEQKAYMMKQSLQQFSAAMTELIDKLSGTSQTSSINEAVDAVGKAAPPVEEADDDRYDTIEEVFP